MMNELRMVAHDVRSLAFSQFRAGAGSSDLSSNDLTMSTKSAQRLERVKDFYGYWIASVANTISDRLAGLSPTRVVRLFENDVGELTFQGGAQSTDLFARSEQLAIVNDRLESDH